MKPMNSNLMICTKPLRFHSAHPSLVFYYIVIWNLQTQLLEIYWRAQLNWTYDIIHNKNYLSNLLYANGSVLNVISSLEAKN